MINSVIELPNKTHSPLSKAFFGMNVELLQVQQLQRNGCLTEPLDEWDNYIITCMGAAPTHPTVDIPTEPVLPQMPSQALDAMAKLMAERFDKLEKRLSQESREVPPCEKDSISTNTDANGIASFTLDDPAIKNPLHRLRGRREKKPNASRKR